MKCEATMCIIAFAALSGCAQLVSSQQKPEVAAVPSELELFVLAGQSNMAGRGKLEPQDVEPLPGVYVLDQEMHWKQANDPLHFDDPKITGAGLGRSFAKVLHITRPSVKIGLIPTAAGNTSLEQWRPGGELYRNAVTRARHALKSGRLRAILWHQGESDAQKHDLAASYGSRFGDFIRNLRQDLGAEKVPVIVGQIGNFGRFPFASTVNEQLARLPLQVPHCSFVSAAGLTHKGDNVHFDSASLRELGRRYAFAFLGLDASWMPVESRQAVSAAQSGR